MLGSISTRLAVVMCVVFAGAALGFFLLDPHRPATGVVVLDRADEAIFTAEDGTTLWHAENVALSQNWSTDTPLAVRAARGAVEARYSLRFALSDPERPASIMIARVSQSVRIEIDGVEIHDDRDDRALERWDWYSPVIAEIPDGVLRPDGNILALTVAATSGSVAGLSRIFLGEREGVEQMGGRLHFLQKPLPTYANVSVMAMSVPLLLIWLHGRGIAGRPFGIYGLLAAASMLFALRSLHVHVAEPPMPHHLWIALVGASLGWALGFFFAFMLHFVGVGSRRGNRALALFVAAGTLVMLILPSQRQAELGTLLWYVPLAAVGIACVAVVCVRTVRAPDSGRIGLSLSLLLLLAASIHDVMWARGVLAFESLLWMPLVMPAVLLAISAAIANRFVQAWLAADALSRNLAARVRDAEAELSASYERRLVAERRETLAAERAKLVEDLHDGVGSRLSLLLTTLQVSDMPRERTVEALRDCLGDLRMVITARDRGTLGEALTELCGQLGDLLRMQGVALDLEIEPRAAALRFGPRDMLNLLRFVQEACTNAGRHGRGDRIRLECGLPDADTLSVRVSEGGKPRSPGGPAPESSGRGVATMKARAGRMGGRLDIDRRAEGWRIGLNIPLPHSSSSEEKVETPHQGRAGREAGTGRLPAQGVAVK